MVSLLATVIASGLEPDRLVLATIRTAVLALGAVTLAWASERSRLPSLTWLVYTILVIGAAKLAFEDLRAGGSAGLFVSLAFYGGALILAPRLLRRTPDDERGDSS